MEGLWAHEEENTLGTLGMTISDYRSEPSISYPVIYRAISYGKRVSLSLDQCIFDAVAEDQLCHPDFVSEI